MPQFTFDEAETKIGEIIKNGPATIGRDEVIGQRNYLAGVIQTWFECGKISEEVRKVLAAIYFEGWEKYVAFEMHEIENPDNKLVIEVDAI